MLLAELPAGLYAQQDWTNCSVHNGEETQCSHQAVHRADALSAPIRLYETPSSVWVPSAQPPPALSRAQVCVKVGPPHRRTPAPAAIQHRRSCSRAETWTQGFQLMH